MYQVEKECTFFSQVDRVPKIDKETGQASNEIGSSYPVYMHEANIEKLKESINEKETALASGGVHVIEIEETKRKLQMEKRKLSQIEDSMPEITPELYTKISNEVDRLGTEISRAQFTERDMQLGHASADKEAKRMRLPCVKVDPEMAFKCNIKLDKDGKATRSEAEKVWKILTWLKTDGEGYTNVDTLRRRQGGSVAPKSRPVSVGVGFDEKGDIVRDSVIGEAQNVTIDNTLENKEVTIDKKPSIYICPDCDKEMKLSAKPIHDARWCPAKQEKKEELVAS